MLAPFLSVPLPVLEHIRNKREAISIVRIGIQAHNFDALVTTLAETDGVIRNLADYTRAVEEASDETMFSLLPILAQAWSRQNSFRRSILDQITVCRIEFDKLCDAFRVFMEANLCSSKEFEEAGCIEKAILKSNIAELERILIDRLRCITAHETITADVSELWGVSVVDICFRFQLLKDMS